MRHSRSLQGESEHLRHEAAVALYLGVGGPRAARRQAVCQREEERFHGGVARVAEEVVAFSRRHRLVDGEEARLKVRANRRHHPLRLSLAQAIAPADGASYLGSHRIMPGEGDDTLRGLPACLRLGDIVE